MAEKQKTKNQTEDEFFVVAGTGRRGVENMLDKMGGEIRAIAAQNVSNSFDTWSTRALVEIANRDELSPVLQTRKGIFSIYKCLAKAATMGLQIGGQFPQAYFMPAEGKAELVVTAEGYAFVAAHGPGAVLRSVPELIRVYEQDDFLVDQKAGVVEHSYDPRADRGRLCGWYMRLEYVDGHVEIPYASLEKVEKIIEHYSRTKTKSGALMPAFAKSPDEMRDKTAAKKLLKRPAREAEGLAMLYSLESPADEEPPQPAMRNVTERMNDRLDKVMQQTEKPAEKSAEKPAEEEKAPEPEKEEKQKEEKQKEKKPEKKPAEKPKPGDLF